MADEVVKIIKIEAQGSETSVKQLRQEVASLRDALLNTEKDSDQYKQTVEKLTNAQNQLAEVMKVGKETFVGSRQELKALKLQMDQLQEGTAEYNAAFQRAAEITHTLQERQELLNYSAADVGTQLSNMVSIGSSLAAGFNSINAVMALTGSKSEDLQKVMVKLQAGIALVQGLQGLEGLTKRMKGMVNGLTEMIFKTNGTTAAVGAETVAVKANTTAQEANIVATEGATVATNGFKKALIATGIGAIVVLIGTLVANWNDLKESIGLSNDKLERFGQVMDTVISTIVGLGNAIGKFLITPIKNVITLLSTLGDVLYDVFTFNWSDIGDDIEAGFSELIEDAKDGYDLVGNYQEAFNKKSTQLANASHQEKMKAYADEMNGYLKDIEAKYGSDWKYTKEGKKLYDEYFKMKLAGYDKESKEYRDAQREMWSYNREYQKRIDDANKAAADEAAREAKRQAEEKERERQKDIEAIEAFYKRSKDFAKEDKQRELDDLEEKYNTEKALLDERKDDFENYQEILTSLTSEYEKKRKDIEDKYKKQREADATKEALKTAKGKLQESDDKNTQTVQTIELEYSLKEAKSSGSLSFNDLIEKTNRIYEANKQHLLEQAAEYKQLMEDTNISEEERVNAKRDYENAIMEMNNLTTQNTIDNLNLQKEAIEHQIQIYSDLANSIGDIFGSIADMMEDEIKKEVEAGDISEEEGKRRFEAVKRLQIAQATIQMLAGVATALAGAFTTKTGPWDMVLAGVQAAAIAASGIAQITKIKNTQLGGSSSVSSSAAATPVQTAPEQYVPQYTANATGESELVNLANSIKDQRCYVLEADITDAQNRQKVRVKESQW